MRLTLHTSRTRARALTLSVRGGLIRFSHLIMIALALCLIAGGQFRPDAVSRLRMGLVDALAPFLTAVSSPIASMGRLSASVHDYMNMEGEMQKLRADKAELMSWRDTALRLQAENDALKQLLNYKPDPAAQALTARVIAEPEASLGQNLLVLAGSSDGVRTDAVVATDRGLLGRLIEVGSRTSRVLLLTDISSRVPVWVEKNHDHAILAGSNDGTPSLQYLPADTDVIPGDRIVTSGQGGVFPAGIPVGTVSSIEKGRVKVALFASLAHVDYARIMNYSDLIPTPDDDADDGDDVRAPAAANAAFAAPPGAAPQNFTPPASAPEAAPQAGASDAAGDPGTSNDDDEDR